MKISDAEAAVAEHWGKSDREFSFAAEQLVQSLLSSFQVETGRFARCADGLLPQYEEKTPESYFCTAVLLFLPDQSVEPVSLNFSFDAEAGKLRTALVQYGLSGWETAVFGDGQYRKMLGVLSTMPKADRDWLWLFSLMEGNWSAQRLTGKRNPLLWPAPTE
jgi:hypothetical protein